MLIKDYYTIEEETATEEGRLFRVRLNPDCTVYQGHFPEEPVSPGVCNIQMLKELAEQTAGEQLFLHNLQLCRLTTLIAPQTHPTMEAAISLSSQGESYKLRASLSHNGETCLEMKAELSIARQ